MKFKFQKNLFLVLAIILLFSCEAQQKNYEGSEKEKEEGLIFP